MIVHWRPPDPAGDLSAHAFRRDRARPVRVHVRPELARRLAAEHAAQLNGHPAFGAQVGDLCGVPVVVDARIPFFPGFEVHRTPPERNTPA